MTTKPRPKHLTLRPAEVARFLRPSGLVVIPLDKRFETINIGPSVQFTHPAFHSGTIGIERLCKEYCPLGGPGSEWVGREAFIPCVGCGLDSKTADASYVCLEDGTQIFRNGNVDKWTLKDPPNWKGYRFRPASQMPLWASRIRKTTTRVELRRVRTITNDECELLPIEPDRATDHPRGVWYTAAMAYFTSRYPGAWDRDDHAFFCWYTDTLGKD